MEGVVQVLYVDDEAALLELGKDFLEMDGDISVDTVLSASAAIDVLKKKSFDVIVSDYQMPGMDGIAFLKKIRSESDTIPFILFTGRGREEIVIQALNEGADFYLQKGGDPSAQFAELVHKIKKSVAQRTAERQLLAVNGEVKRRLEEEKIISEFSQVLLNATSADEVLEYFGDMVFGISGADYQMLGKLFPDENAIGIHSLRGFGPLLEQVGHLIHGAPESLKVPVDVITAHKEEIPFEPGLKKLDGGISAISRGYLPKSVCSAMEKLLRVKTIYSYELVWEGNLYGSITFGFREGHEIYNPSLLNTLGNLLANGLWRIYSANAIATERHSLAESEAKFRTIFENSPYPIAINASGDGKFIAVNNAFLQSSGYTEQEIIGKNPVELGLLSLADFGRLTSHVLLHGMLDNVPMTLMGKGGRRVHVQYSTIPVRINNKPVVMTVTAEISNLKRVEEELLKKNEELRESENKFRSLYETMAQGVVYQDSAGAIISANPAAERILGLNLDQLLGKQSIDPSWKTIREDGSPLPGTDHPAMVSLRTGKPTGPFIMGVFHPAKNSHSWLSVTAIPQFRPGEAVPYRVYTTFDDITGRIQAEEALRESEEKYRSFVEKANEAVTIIQDWRMVYANPRMADLVGIPVKDLVGMEFLDTVWPDDREMVRTRYAKRCAGENVPETYDFRMTGPGGKPRWIYISIAKIQWQGRPATLNLMTDITERKIAEQKIQQSRDMFRAFVDHSYDAVFISDLSGRIIDVNATLLSLYRVTREQALTLTIDDFSGPASRMNLEDSQKIWNDVLAGNDHVFPRQAMRPSDGSLFDVEVYLTRIEVENQPVILANVRDVTDRKRAEEGLRKSEEKYRKLYDSMMDAFAGVDINGRFTFFNDAFVSMIGYGREEIPNLTYQDVTPEKWIPEEKEILEKQVYTRGYSDIYEKEYRRKDGTIFPVELRTLLMKDESGNPLGMWAIIRDITGRKRAEEAIRLANRKLNLLSGITRHDIKNQLMMLSGYLAISGKTLEDPVRTAEFIEKERKIAETISRQISFTKDYEDLGVKAPVWQNVSVMLTRIFSGLPMKDIRIDPPDPTLEIFADPLLEKVFYNLIDNALRYGGEMMTAIRIFGRMTGEDLVIVVEDDGAGIAADDKVRLFERGFGKNTGLGLFLSREILSITGITITETGEPGRGACFEILVPKRQYRYTS